MKMPLVPGPFSVAVSTADIAFENFVPRGNRYSLIWSISLYADYRDLSEHRRGHSGRWTGTFKPTDLWPLATFTALGMNGQATTAIRRRSPWRTDSGLVIPCRQTQDLAVSTNWELGRPGSYLLSFGGTEPCFHTYLTAHLYSRAIRGSRRAWANSRTILLAHHRVGRAIFPFTPTARLRHKRGTCHLRRGC